MMKTLYRLPLVFLLIAFTGTALAQPPTPAAHRLFRAEYTRQEVPHTWASLDVPAGWVWEFDQGNAWLATSSRNFFYSPSEPFRGALIHIFLSDAPRAAGPSFDVLKLAQDFMATQSMVAQEPVLATAGDREMVTALYLGRDSKGQRFTYLAGFDVQSDVLTVFLAATPQGTAEAYLPVLMHMLESIEIEQSQD